VSAPVSQLQSFLAVARHQNFGAAARELGVSRSAVSKSVGQLEEQLGVVLLVRTTRSVALTDAGRSLFEAAAPAWAQITEALAETGARAGETVGRLRLTVPRAALPFVIEPVVPVFRERHPRIALEISVEERLVDIVAEGYDAGVRMSESLERDMVQVRLTDAFRFVVVGAPSYLAQHGVPQRPPDLLTHTCIGYRSLTTGAVFPWELESGRKTWKITPSSGVTTTDGLLGITLAERGVGLLYVFESMVNEQVADRRLQIVLPGYAATVPGFFLYFPNRAQRSGPLRLFVDTAKELSQRTLTRAAKTRRS
jgi:DNA-binding transcriptional LysR family regulator